MKNLHVWPNPSGRIFPFRSTSPTLSHVRFVPPPSPSSVRCHSSLTQHPFRCAVLGAGFAGLSVVWHLLKQSPKELNLRVDVYDEVGIGGGASGMSGGLLHPYSPKVKLLWEGAQCWKESMELLRAAEEASVCKDYRTEESAEDMEAFVVHKS